MAMLKSMLTIALLSYLGFGLYLYIFQRNFIYFPIGEKQSEKYQYELLQHKNITLKIWTANPGHDKAVIYFGGNAENVFFNADDFVKALPDHSIYLVNYRGYGGSNGSPTEEGLYQDALTIHDHLINRHSSITVVGRSLGSAVAVYLASQRDIRKLILITPFDSLISLASDMYPLYPVNLLLKDRYDSTKHAKSVSAPALILLAGNDRIIPHKHAHQLAKNFPEEQLTLRKIAGADHNSISYYPEYWRKIADFLYKHNHQHEETR